MSNATAQNGVEMEAGREMDALIAERVMGHQWRDVRLRGETNTVPVLLAPRVGDIDGMYDRASLRAPRYPDYSTDLAAAGEVMEAMRAEGVYIDVLSRLCGYDATAGWEGRDGEDIWRQVHVELAPTAPLAICRAALLACEAR